MDLIYDAGQAWGDYYGLGPCGVVACLISDKYRFQIAIGEHEDYGPGPSHSWNITDEGTYVDFSLYPDGKIPDRDLHKYGEILETFDFCKEALSDIFALGPGINYEQEWKDAKAYIQKYLEMVGWWRLMPTSDRYNILLQFIKVGPRDADFISGYKWEDITDHVKLKLMLHYTNFIDEGPPGGKTRSCPPGQDESDGFCRERKVDPKIFDKRSFKTICPKCPDKECERCEEAGINLSKTTHIVIGCPKGKYQPRKDRCKVGTRMQSIYRPKSRFRE